MYDKTVYTKKSYESVEKISVVLLQQIFIFNSPLSFNSYINISKESKSPQKLDSDAERIMCDVMSIEDIFI